MIDSAQYHTVRNKKNPPKPDSAQYHTAQSQQMKLEGKAPRSMILCRAWLRAVWYCAELDSAQFDAALSHSILRGVNCHFFTLLHRPLKGKFQKKEYIFLIYLKRATFFIFAAKSQENFFVTPRSMILCGVSFFDTKIWISQWKRNRIRKYFNPLVRSLGWFDWWKKLGVENLVGLSL